VVDELRIRPNGTKLKAVEAGGMLKLGNDKFTPQDEEEGLIEGFYTRD